MLRALGVALKSGRDFSTDDRGDVAPSVLINEAAAKKFWPGQSPIGARIRLGPDPSAPWSTVIGVIGDYRQEQLDAPPPPLAITNFRQDAWSSMFITTRTKDSPVALRATLIKAIRELDPALAVDTPAPMTQMIGGELGRRRFVMSILSVFGGVALVLAVLGVYGVIAYGVAARRQEFGVRAALGAVPRDLVKMVLGQGATLLAGGLVLGTVAAVGLTRLLKNLLFGVPSLDLATFAGAGGVLALATLVAIWIPARRAASADPMRVLRDE
jgi:hypothetical protein